MIRNSRRLIISSFEIELVPLPVLSLRTNTNGKLNFIRDELLTEGPLFFCDIFIFINIEKI